MRRQKYRLVLVFQTIGRGGDVSFLDQSQRVVQQNSAIPEYFYYSIGVKSG